MIKASISNLKNRLSDYLRKVQAGHSVIVCDRDVPIARIERIDNGAGNDRLAAIRALGISHPPKKRLTVALLARWTPVHVPAAQLTKALLEDRDDSR